jgi:UDP-N-acetylglucosamine 2-epimerase (non-hydrolysing)
MRVLTVIGTRPEAIKMAPVLRVLAREPSIEAKLCVTGQHREMLHQVLDLFELRTDFDLNVMQAGQNLYSVATKILERLPKVFEEFRPDYALVHGDTSTTLYASLTALYERVPLAHVEAGLRTGNLSEPWPEEANRRLTSAVTSLHFAPTQTARENLLREGVPATRIVVTGNTVIDALLAIREKLQASAPLRQAMAEKFGYLRPQAPLVLITGHRRENFGEGFERICESIQLLAARHAEVDFVYPVHLNPNVQAPVKQLLRGLANVHLVEPLDYVPFVYLMMRSRLLLSDSGGVQEEAPALGRPVLVMRDTTERPEAVAAGTVKLVGTDVERIVSSVSLLLNDEIAYRAMTSARNPYGDGHAAARIVQSLLDVSRPRTNDTGLETNVS